MIEQRKAGMERTKAEMEESRADLWEKDREANRAERLVAKKMVPQEDYEKASSLRKMAIGAGRGARSFAQDDEGQHRRDGVYPQVPDAHPRAV